MSKSTHQIAVKAVDQTAPAFGSIQNRAAAATAKIRGALGGALAAAGAYLSFRAVKSGIDELGHLSDVAMKTSTNVGELTGAVNAMGILGIQNMSVEQLAKSFDYMQKTTGRAGMQGFYDTIGEIGKIPDVALRGQEAMRIFGRSGMEFMPLINAADMGTQALSDLVQAMPRVPQAAADAGDAASDAMAIAANGVKSVWLQGLAAVCGWFDNQYTGGIRQASAMGANYLEYYAKLGVQGAMRWFSKLQGFFEKFGAAIGTFIGAKMNGAGWGEAFDMAMDQYEFEKMANDDYQREQDKLAEERKRNWEKEFEDKKIVLEKFNKSYSEAAISTKQRELKGITGDDLASKAPTIRNDLLMGGSNAAMRAAVLGPSLQNETKKQTKILEQIAANTKKTADAETTDDYGTL